MSSKEVVKHLNIVLAETYALYLKTQNCHWNVTGPNFHSLHGMFEEQYKELAEAIDEIAERIRALGEKVEASFAYFDKAKSISDAKSANSSESMLKDLLQSQEIVIGKLVELSDVAAAQGDKASEDMAVQRLHAHEKQRWMLSSSL
ncbi:MAG: DNA starvation/stationary phase protection protein [Pseudomonadota bacterium]